MAKIKRKLPAPAPKPQIDDEDDDSGSDYDVERYMKPKKMAKTVAEEFPLPKQVRKDLVQRSTGGEESESDDDQEEDSSEDDGNLPTLTKKQIEAILQTIKNNKRLVLNVSNVNFSTAKEEIHEYFRKAGRVKSVRIPKRRASGFAFVEMLDAEGFQKAFLLDGTFLDGRQIRVQLSESGKKKSHQKILQLERKNAEIRKMRKQNRVKPEATEVTLTPKVQPKVVERDPYLDKQKTKAPTRKEIKAHKKKVSLKAKFRNVAMKGIKV